MMMSKALALRRSIASALAPLCASTAVAEMEAPAVGMFAFDWLQPKTARCQVVSESLLTRFRSCKREDGAFGLSDPVHVCRVDARSEYMVFDTRRTCERNLETMKANAP